jgi:hypothetical protein
MLVYLQLLIKVPIHNIFAIVLHIYNFTLIYLFRYVKRLDHDNPEGDAPDYVRMMPQELFDFPDEARCREKLCRVERNAQESAGDILRMGFHKH